MNPRRKLNHITIGDIVVLIVLGLWALVVLFPFISVIMISFATENEYLSSLVFLYPKQPTLANYTEIFNDSRIWSGYRNTLTLLLMGVPLSLFLTTCFSYALSRTGWIGRKFLFYVVLFTMLFNGGIIPVYLLMREFDLTNTLWSVVLANTINTFYMIIMRNFISSLPESLIESAKLDGAGEWRILGRIILPLSMPIIATLALFYTVDRWNEWYHPLVFLQRGALHPLQLVLRSIVLDSQLDLLITTGSGSSALDEIRFSMGLKTATIIVAMLPVMLVFPFLQKYFVKGVMVGAVKS